MSYIKVSYENNKIIINENGNSLIDEMPTFNFTDQTLSAISPEMIQLILRKLDCLKDAKEGDGIKDKTDIMNKIFDTGNDNKYNKLDLNVIKEGVFNQNKDKIQSYSWLKSSTLNENLSFIKNVFFETGLGPKSYIKDFKNPTTKVFDMIGNFQNEVGDPFSRKTEDITIRYPEQVNTTISFDKSFMNYFGFLDVNYESKLVGKSNEGGIYNYTIDLGNSNTYSSSNITKMKNSGTPIQRFLSTTLPSQSVIVCSNEYKLINKVTGDEYFKGNDYKNAVINALNQKSNNLPEIKRYIIGKELGDVMQILLMMVWQIAEKQNKKNYCMVSLDSIVFLLCNILEQPCFYTHNSNKGKASEDKCYAIQYFFPTVITQSERMKMRLDQKYNEIFANNLKIKNFLNRIFIEGILYIGNTKIDYKNDNSFSKKRSIIENNFIKPINNTITEVSEKLEEFYNKMKDNDNIQEENLTYMNNEYLLLPFIGMTQNKSIKKINKYYVNGKISDYTKTIPLEYNGTKYSFKNLFNKLNSGTLRGGAGENDDLNIINEESQMNVNNDNYNNFPENIVSPPSIEEFFKDNNQELKNSSSNNSNIITDNNDYNNDNENLENQEDTIKSLIEPPTFKSSNSPVVEEDSENEENKMDSQNQELEQEIKNQEQEQSNINKIPNDENNQTDISQINTDEIYTNQMDINQMDTNEMDSEQINTEQMDSIYEMNPTYEMNANTENKTNMYINHFTDSLFLTFINQIVEFIEDSSNELTFEDNYDGFYYYYDMICYICYINKQVYYDNDLLSLMKQLKDYSNGTISIDKIINNLSNIRPSFISNESEKEDNSLSLSNNSCLVNNSITLNKFPKAIQYTEELFDTLNTIDSQELNNVTIDFKNDETQINQDSPLPSLLNTRLEPDIGVKRSRDTNSSEETNTYKKNRFDDDMIGGKTVKRKRSIKKHKKTKKGGSYKKKKRSIKKKTKASRRKRKTLKKRGL